MHPKILFLSISIFFIQHNLCNHKKVCFLSCLHKLDCCRFWPISNHFFHICNSSKLLHPLVGQGISAIFFENSIFIGFIKKISNEICIFITKISYSNFLARSKIQIIWFFAPKMIFHWFNLYLARKFKLNQWNIIVIF